MPREYVIKIARTTALIAVLGLLYGLALVKHQAREQQRAATVVTTAACTEKLAAYGLQTDEHYVSPYRANDADKIIVRNGYHPADIRAIQRGCNIIDDLQGQEAEHDSQRWYAKRYVRGDHTSCDHCHQGIGDKQDTNGQRLLGSLSLGASWVNGGDTYDRFTGILLPYELRQMQCFINSSNGFKPNIADDLIRDITAYTRFLSGALDLKIQTHYPEQGVDEIPASSTHKQGDDYVRGAALYQQKCAHCHGVSGLGTVHDGRVIYPAVAGPNAFNRQSRNYFRFVSTILPGFICRNMPLGQEGSLSNQQCRDIGFYIGNLPRPAGDKEGPAAALWQQFMMVTMPRVIHLFSPPPKKTLDNDP